jgi:hypothetical protein
MLHWNWYNFERQSSSPPSLARPAAHETLILACNQDFEECYVQVCFSRSGVGITCHGNSNQRRAGSTNCATGRQGASQDREKRGESRDK